MSSNLVNDNINKIAGALWKEIILQREEIITSFIAKYGCLPDEIIQIHQITPDGESRWIVRKMTEEEKKSLRVGI